MPEFTQNYELRKPGPTPGAKYPVEKWVTGIQQRTADWRKKGCKGDQPALRLTRYTDFETSTASMAEYIWKYRRDRNLPVRLATAEDTVLIFWDGK